MGLHKLRLLYRRPLGIGEGGFLCPTGSNLRLPSLVNQVAGVFAMISVTTCGRACCTHTCLLQQQSSVAWHIEGSKTQETLFVLLSGGSYNSRFAGCKEMG